MTPSIMHIWTLAERIRYLVSRLLEPLLGCDINSLRILNAGALCLTCPVSYGILRALRARQSSSQHTQQNEKSKEQISTGETTAILDAHSALNIALFPPLFFFSALYYTDVMSTLVVMWTYSAYLKRDAASRSFLDDMITVLTGFVALWFRQTNIFWVAVFPAGLAIVDVLKPSHNDPAYQKPSDATAIFNNSWSDGSIYDCSIHDAGPRGMCVIT